MSDLPPPPGPGWPPPGPSTPPPPPPAAPPWAQYPPPPAGVPPAYGPPPGYAPAPPYPGAPGYAPPLANFGERLLAKLLDGLILMAGPTLVAILGIVVIVTGPNHESTCTVTEYSEISGEYITYRDTCTLPDGGTVAAAVAIWIVAAILLVLIYVYYYRREGRTGLTWGRKAMGIRLVGLHTNQPIGSWQAFGRGLFANYISGAFCYLGYLWMLWDPQRQCWHDKVVDSKVIKG